MAVDDKNKFNNSYIDNFLFNCPQLNLTNFKAVDIVLPGMSLDTSDVQTGKIIERLPGLVWHPDNLVITWVMDEDWRTYIEVLSWILKIKQTDEEQLPDVVGSASVVITDNHGKGKLSFRYTNFFPIGINSITMASNTGVAPPIYGVAAFALTDIVVDQINGNEYEDLENLVRQ